MWMRAALCSAFLLAAVDESVAQQRTSNERIPIRLEFKAGTLQSYVDAVRGQQSSANIVIDGDSIANILLPPASIRTVSLPQALQWVVTTTSARRMGLILQPTGRSASDTAVVWVFTTAQAPVSRPLPAPEMMTKDHVLDSIPGRGDWHQALTAAVDGKLAKRKPRTGTVEYIASNRILRVTGTRLDIQDADQTIDEVERSQLPFMVLPQLQAEVSKLRQQVDSLNKVITGMLTRLPPRGETSK